MEFQLITLEISNHVALLTLNHPASRNGLTPAMQKEMLAALASLVRDGEARALIITGAGRSFCAGADLVDIMRARPDGASIGQQVADVIEHFSNPLILALRSLPFPVLAAVNGAAAGAGVSIALAADIVIAARSAFFMLPFLPRMGILPDMGATWVLPRSVGKARTLGLMLLGDRLTAARAVDWGLIWDVVDDTALPEQARAIAGRLALAPAHSITEARKALEASDRNDLAVQLQYERARQRELLDLPSFAEGVSAFFEKREPVFKR